MPRHLAAGAIATLVLGAVLAAAPPKTKPKAAPKPSAPPLAVTTPVLTTPMPIACPDALGQGVKSGRVFCEVPVSHDPAHGDLIVVPRHQGPAFVRFHLHNRQLVSASLIKAKRAFTRATATVVVVKADGTVTDQSVVGTEYFRRGTEPTEYCTMHGQDVRSADAQILIRPDARPRVWLHR